LGQKRIFAILGIITGLLLVQACGREMPAQQSCNFVQNSELQRVSWKTDLPVTLYLDASIPYDYVPSIQNAMAIWNAIGQQYVKQNFFVLGNGDPGSPTPTVDGYNKIYLLNSWESDLSDQQARTTVYWSGSRIYEADMRIDAANFQFYTDNSNPDPTKVNLESLVLHELGHVLGMAHDPVPTSVMQPSLANGSLRLTPGQVDLSSIGCEY
jgi:Matrixin